MGTYDHGNLVYALPEDLVESEEDEVTWWNQGFNAD